MQRSRKGPNKSKEHGPPDVLQEPKELLDQVIADHKTSNDDDMSREKDKVALIIQDRVTSWLKAWWLKGKTAKLAKERLERFQVHASKSNMHTQTDLMNFIKHSRISGSHMINQQPIDHKLTE